jgi:hypothetical protein
MNSELLHQVVEMIEAEGQARRSGMEFDMAYQARVAIDRIKLAVKRSEQGGGQPDQMRDSGARGRRPMVRISNKDLHEWRAAHKCQSRELARPAAANGIGRSW